MPLLVAGLAGVIAGMLAMRGCEVSMEGKSLPSDNSRYFITSIVMVGVILLVIYFLLKGGLK